MLEGYYNGIKIIKEGIAKGEQRTNKLNYQIISKNQDEYKLYEKLTPPRVILNMNDAIYASVRLNMCSFIKTEKIICFQSKTSNFLLEIIKKSTFHRLSMFFHGIF